MFMQLRKLICVDALTAFPKFTKRPASFSCRVRAFFASWNRTRGTSLTLARRESRRGPLFSTLYPKSSLAGRKVFRVA